MVTSKRFLGTRKVFFGASIALLLITAFGCDYFKAKGEFTGDKVTVVSFSSREIQLPQGFEKAFQGFKGILLVDEQGKVTAIKPTGKTINLCDPLAPAEKKAKEDCDMVLTTYDLVDALSGTLSCGRCDGNTCNIKTFKKPCSRGVHNCDCS